MKGDPLGLVGQTIAGKYRVLDVIGEGGYGVVYAGTHLVLGQPIAIKCIKTLAATGDEAARDAFMREARVLFGLLHPGIVRLYDAGIEVCAAGAIPYAVLELVDGVPLDREISTRRREGRRMTGAEIARIADGVLDAVAFAHARGVIHRDLKPSNVMLTAAGVKVLDFGTARLGSASRSVGAAAFTPMYAAAEQWNPQRFGPTTARTDVAALGLIIAEMATLSPPFAATSLADLVAAAQDPNDRPRLRTRADLPPALDDVVLRATRPDPRERYADAGELRAAVAEAFGASPGPRAAASGWVLAGAGAAILAITFTAVWFGVRAIVGKRAHPAATATSTAPEPAPAESEIPASAPSAPSAAPSARPPPTRARVARASLVEASGGDFDRSGLDRVYRNGAAEVASCGARAFARDPTTSAIDAWLHVSTAGDRECHADAEGPAQKELCACLVSAAARWRLPPADTSSHLLDLEGKSFADFHVRVTAE